MGGNVDIVRRALEAFNDRDLDRAVAFAAEDVVLHMADEDPTGRSYCGREALRRFWESVFAFWSEWRCEPVRFVEAGDRVVVVYDVCLVGRDGLQLRHRMAQLMELRDGAVAVTRLYNDAERALQELR